MAFFSGTDMQANSGGKRSAQQQALLWLFCALILLVITALLWMLSSAPTLTNKIENAPLDSDQNLTQELIQPTVIAPLHELDGAVIPIDFDAVVRDMQHYPEEFKDKRYLTANKGKWTVQVMNVSEHEVVIDYLNTRQDRDKFAYFRFRNEQGERRYMLIYGIMSSPQQAMGAAKTIDFTLPANVRVLPEEIDRYVSIIDNYTRAETVQDLNSYRDREINLAPTHRQAPALADSSSVDDTTTGSETGNNGNEAASRTQSDATSAPAPAASSIRGSQDGSDTLAVQESRSISEPAADAKAASDKSQNKPTSNSKDDRTVSNRTLNPNRSGNATPAAEPKNSNPTSQTKPQSQSTPAQPADSNRSASPPAAEKPDSIKQLIEDKNL